MMADQKEMTERAWLNRVLVSSAFVELAQHPTNPLTDDDLRKLVAKRPETYGHLAGFIGKLGGRLNP